MLRTLNPQYIRDTLRQGDDPDLRSRRAVIALSVVGLASMTATSLFQTGLLRRLPSPPLPGSDSERVALDQTAYPLGLPDGTIALAGFALNLPLAAYGGADRARRMPWLPLFSTAKAAADLGICLFYLAQMPTRMKAWCIYNFVATAANVGILVQSLPEARRALTALGGR